MPAIGGAIVSVSFDGRNFPAAADADTQRKLGGDMNEVQANGDGTNRLIKTPQPWSLDGLTVECDDSRNDQEFLQGLADRQDFWPVGITYASGEVYQGTGQIVGDLQMGNQNATAAVSLMGNGRLTKQ